MNIAVTATGGGVGQSIIKSLKGYNVIALDSDCLAAGLYMTDRHRIIPLASDDNYISALLKVCEDENIDMLFPGMDIELKKISENGWRFKKTYPVISNSDIIELADDKYLTNQFLVKNDLPFPKTNRFSVIAKVWNMEYPYILKPKNGGARSKDVYFVKNENELKKLDINLLDFVAQEYIEGDEYTCGTLTLNGKYRGCIVLRRILRDGDTYKAFVERNKTIEDLCEKICTIIKPNGAFNIQLRMRDGVPYVFEFNARCSGTTAMRALAGFNEPQMTADYILKGIEPVYKIKDLTVLRYWNEIIKR